MDIRLISERRIAGAFEEDYREARIPALLVLKDGAALAAYEARAGQNGDWGDIDIIVKRLEPDGELHQVLRLGESHLPPDGSMRTWGNPTLIDAGNSEVLLLYCRNYERAYCIRSRDGGRSWSDNAEITEALRGFPWSWNVCAVGPGHGTVTPGGRITCGIWLANGEAYDNGLRRRHAPSVSGALWSDDGAHFHSGFLFDALKDPSETACAALPDGRVLFSIRNADKERKRTFAFSNDGGRTVDHFLPRTLADPTCFGGLCAYGQGVLQVNCLSPDRREHLTISYSEDGVRWQALYRFDGPAGYADIGALEDKIFVLAEREDREKHLIGSIDLYTLQVS